jgi:hypothetical protein
MALYPPKTKPANYGAKAGDYHMVVDAASGNAKMYEYSSGKLLWTKPCLATGQRYEFWKYSGDTPPGVYYLGDVYDDAAKKTMERAYGWVTFDMVDCEGREDGNDRSGICLHGGGSGAPDPFAPYQQLLPTYGCLRMYNQDLYDFVYPLYKKGKIWISVYQDDV